MTLGIERIAYYLPQQSLSAADLASQFGFDPAFVSEKLGVSRIFVAGEQEQTSDLAVAALRRLFDEVPGLQTRLQALVVCTQTPDFQLPQVSALVQDKAGLSRGVAAFDISLGCSGFVYGLSVLLGFMTQNDFDTGVLITAETYSKIIDATDRNTKCLFSDAAAATLVGRNAAVLPGKFTFGTGGDKFASLILRSRDSRDGAAACLFMDGRGIFEFVADVVPSDVNCCLQRNAVALSDLDFLVFHQASNFLLDTIGRRLGIPGDPRLVKVLDKFANTVSSSVPLALTTCLERRTRPQLKILISGFGVGLSWASTVLTAQGAYDEV